MSNIKKWVCLFLCVVLLVSLAACGKNDKPRSSSEADSANVVPAVTEEPTPEPTMEPTTDSVTAEFLSLDRELFLWYVTQDITYLDQFVSDPSAYGIDESTVPVTLGEFTEAENLEWCSACEQFLQQLDAIDRGLLNEDNQYAYDVIQQYLNFELMFKNSFYYYEPLEEYVGFQSNLPLTFGLYQFHDTTDVENYLTLMADVPRYVQQIVDFEQKRAELGLFMTETALDAILADCTNMIRAKETCYLYDTFKEELEKLPDLSEEQKAAYIERSNDLVANSFIAGYQLLYDGLEVLRPSCRSSVGLAGLGSEAKEYFVACLKSESSSALEPQEAADLLVKYANACLQNYQMLYFSDPTLLDRSETGAAITFGSIDEDVAYLKQLMAEYMPELPEVEVNFTEIPDELQESFSPAAYLIPSIDGWQHNTVLINPRDGSDLMTMAHEAYPGHLFQFVYQRASDNESLFQRLVSPVGYEEGWTTNVELSISKRAESFDASYCLFEHYGSYISFCLYAACSIYVNYFEYTPEELAVFLSDWNLDSYADELYQISVDMPSYYFCYALGYCLQQEVYAKVYETYAFTDEEFYTAYLDLGAGYFNLIEPRMLAWAQSKTA